jgi:hypothetical protein
MSCSASSWRGPSPSRGASLQPAAPTEAAEAPAPAVASLEVTVAKVREVIRAVDATLRHEPPG